MTEDARPRMTKEEVQRRYEERLQRERAEAREKQEQLEKEAARFAWDGDAAEFEREWPKIRAAQQRQRTAEKLDNNRIRTRAAYRSKF